ncbi:MAG: tryptophan--tRNA ligase [Acidobacteriota bacterium]
MAKSAPEKRIFSGIQPSGGLHLGNYLGAIQQWVALQETRTSFICIVDLHAITVPQDRETLTRRTRELAAVLLAAGIDPARTTLFVQSHVRAHAEASWLLSCVTPLGWLERMVQYKDKAARQESVLTGLLTYPVLQAADILLYDAAEVPVGEDQKQHIELTRDIAQRFNHLHGETFVLPQPLIPRDGARIMALDDPTVKMSKSEAGQGHAIRLTDSEAAIRNAIKRATTDSGREIRFSDDPSRAGVNNLLTIYQLVSGRSRAQVEEEFRSAAGYRDLKERVADAVVEKLAPVRKAFTRYLGDPDELDRLLAQGAQRAAAVSEPKLSLVKRRLGLMAPR